MNLLVHPYQGQYKQLKKKSSSNEPCDEYEVYALAKRLNITYEEMDNMSFVSLMNILISNVDEDEERKASQDDIDKFFG